MMNVLVVCHGNICRSPVAAGIMFDKYDHLDVRQGGFIKPGRRSPPKVRRWAEDNLHIDLGLHRSRLATKDDIAWAHTVLYMDGGNLRHLVELNGSYSSKFLCLASYIKQDRLADPNFLAEDRPEFQRAMQAVADAAFAFAKVTR